MNWNDNNYMKIRYDPLKLISYLLLFNYYRFASCSRKTTRCLEQ